MGERVFMCSVFGVLNTRKYIGDVRKEAIKQSHKLLHRGSDHTGVYESDNAILLHNRISIIDVVTGDQPFLTQNEQVVLITNGEIYNHKYIRNNQCADYPFTTDSDCEVILSLYDKMGIHFLEELNGMFGFIIYDQTKDDFLVARDHLGIMGTMKMDVYMFHPKKKRCLIAVLGLKNFLQGII